MSTAGRSRKLSRPLRLKDGRIITTLAGARDFMGGFRESLQNTEHWRDAEELLLKASASGHRVAIERATLQTERALKAEGFL